MKDFWTTADEIPALPGAYVLAKRPPIMPKFDRVKSALAPP
jgi:hypothetical protein